MICKTCGAYIEDDCTFCTECGTVIPNNEMQSFEQYSGQYNEQYGGGHDAITRERNRVNPQIALIIGSTILLVAILGIILYFCSDLHHYRKNYKTGNENFAENKYEEALRCHKEAIKYKETDEVRNAICQDYIKIAEGHLKKENFEKAIKAHQELRKYGKSTKEINSLVLTDYEKWADSCLDEGDFEEAIELHREMADYGESKDDVDERIAEDYEKWADSYLEEDKPMDALLTVHQGIDATSHESLWEKAQEIKDRTVIAEKKQYYDSSNKQGEYSDYNYKYIYDEKGNLITEEVCDIQGVLRARKVRTYDEKGNVITEEAVNVDTSDEEKRVLAEYVYTYDDQNNIVQKEQYNRSLMYSWPTEVYQYTYDKNGNNLMCARISYWHDNSSGELNKYLYDNKNNLIRCENYSLYWGECFGYEQYYDSYEDEYYYAVYNYKDIYTYGENGKKHTKEHYDQDGNISSKITYIYDSYENVIQDSSSNGCNNTYDVFGNWISSDSEPYTYTYIYHYIENKGEI